MQLFIKRHERFLFFFCNVFIRCSIQGWRGHRSERHLNSGEASNDQGHLIVRGAFDSLYGVFGVPISRNSSHLS